MLQEIRMKEEKEQEKQAFWEVVDGAELEQKDKNQKVGML